MTEMRVQNSFSGISEDNKNLKVIAAAGDRACTNSSFNGRSMTAFLKDGVVSDSIFPFPSTIQNKVISTAGAGIVKGAPVLTSTLKNVVKSGGVGGAIIGGGIETVSGIVDLVNGDKDFEEVAVSVVKNTVKGAASGAAAGVAATAAGTAVATGVAAVGLTGAAATVAVAAAPVAIALGVGWVVSEIFSAIFD